MKLANKFLRKLWRYNRMSRSNRIDTKEESDGQEFIDILEAANYYGCQIDRIRDFIARGMFRHVLVDKQEVEVLRQKHGAKMLGHRH